MHLGLRQLFLRHVAQTSPAPLGLEIDKAEGIFLYGADGRKWIDLISGISVSNVGHRHPKVLAAIHEQLERYMHLMVYGEYIQAPQVALAQRLAGILPGLDQVYFVNSGAEAIEGSIKLARRFTGRKKIFSFTQAYHGSTTGALSLMSDPYFREPFMPLLPEVCHLESGSYEDLAFIDEHTAAVFVEIVRGEAGALPIDHDYLHALRARCSAMGTLLIADEIQTGFGRTGDFFASQGVGILPDVIVMAKGMGGGMPIGAFMSSSAIMQCLSHDPVLGHITTFGGHPVSCAAAAAAFDVLSGMDFGRHVADCEALVRTTLRHPAILELSGCGLLLSLRFESEAVAQQIIAACIQRGVITDWFLFAPDRLRICPPLTITLEELESACRIILSAIADVCQHPG
jgi:acetylornithine/succinyldiaminopimelate/putrescine aminotransferase